MSNLKEQIEKVSDEVILSKKITHQLIHPDMELRDHKPLKKYDTEEMYTLLHKLSKTDLITVALNFWNNKYGKK